MKKNSKTPTGKQNADISFQKPVSQKLDAYIQVNNQGNKSKAVKNRA